MADAPTTGDRTAVEGAAYSGGAEELRAEAAYSASASSRIRPHAVLILAFDRDAQRAEEVEIVLGERVSSVPGSALREHPRHPWH